ncbi:manganese peroxidase [Laccaria bicolor S238N-H82]|uniref:Peroxidase n=1 Tax=Laccaria bicolor (strain S238N-H82 / ATCC MYA-4686) TaxID=486041 RepID=B0DVT9_LACBS|nr:manganese peroxidase [Laccaria bicolor S238N-H82]EDR01358.1 manganese peroxidase [Laccaria bicolor S238N-H82]|eukprot:XP_001888065.1 manganese peroxidase [Laccaria bicolor S238N-H82]
MAVALFSTLITLLFGAQIANAAGLSNQVTCSTGHVTSNKACCPLFPIVDNIQQNLHGGGACGFGAHTALRLSFHDAIGFSIHGGKGGGADGSILIFNTTELAYDANVGIDDITADQWPVFQTTGLSAGDFLHLAAAVGTANCPGAPRLQYMFGRPPPVAPAPDNTVPKPTDSVDSMLARMADAGFSPAELVALLASHSIANVVDIDPTVAGIPLDSTSTTFDSQLFLEVLLKGTVFPGSGANSGEVQSFTTAEMRLQSDSAIARDHRTACSWQSMINNQARMMTQFKAAMAKLQVLGQDTSKLIDCSDVIPVPKPFAGPIKYPSSFSQANIEQKCTEFKFPSVGR